MHFWGYALANVYFQLTTNSQKHSQIYFFLLHSVGTPICSDWLPNFLFPLLSRNSFPLNCVKPDEQKYILFSALNACLPLWRGDIIGWNILNEFLIPLAHILWQLCFFFSIRTWYFIKYSSSILKKFVLSKIGKSKRNRFSQ